MRHGTKLNRRYSFAHVTTADNRVDEIMDLRAARALENDGKLTYDGRVIQEDAVEHLFTPTRRFRMTDVPD